MPLPKPEEFKLGHHPIFPKIRFQKLPTLSGRYRCK
jgi:hypothetical protein